MMRTNELNETEQLSRKTETCSSSFFSASFGDKKAKLHRSSDLFMFSLPQPFVHDVLTEEQRPVQDIRKCCGNIIINVSCEVLEKRPAEREGSMDQTEPK